VKVIFNVNVVLDVYDTDGARPCEKPVCKKCASASTARGQNPDDVLRWDFSTESKRSGERLPKAAHGVSRSESISE
jgi:hypothetical protein